MHRKHVRSDAIFLMIVIFVFILLTLAIVWSRQVTEEEEEAAYPSREEDSPSSFLSVQAAALDLPPIVEAAREEIGNEGGEKYWRWYGFAHRVEWCACFVSWCANECGYIDSGTLPKFSLCDKKGLKEEGMWKESEPAAGDLIFFDWIRDGVQDGVIDHVGIVEEVQEGKIYTIEGNCNDAVQRQTYDSEDEQIVGYARPNP